MVTSARVNGSRPVLSETLMTARERLDAQAVDGTLTTYYYFRGAGEDSAVNEGRPLRSFFLNTRPSRRTQGKDKERCASQARSSGSTTPRVTGSSNAKAAATSSSTIPLFRAPVSGPWR